MFLVNKRRVCVVVATLLAGILIPLVSHADSHYGRRYNGAGFNGYWLAQSTLEQNIDFDIPEAYQPWIQACFASGNLKLIQFGGSMNVNPSYTYVRGMDIFTVDRVNEPAFGDNNAVATTGYNKQGPNGEVVEDSDTKYPFKFMLIQP